MAQALAAPTLDADEGPNEAGLAALAMLERAIDLACLELGPELVGLLTNERIELNELGTRAPVFQLRRVTH